MLTAEENDLLCRVGPGTPMGELMRRYWQPIAATCEITDERPVKPVRILGEDLALFRDLRGRLGLIGLYCPHRLRPLTYGIPEEDGLRCPYTYWLFDAEGHCLDIPLEPEDSTLKYEVHTPAYPVQELGGLIWAYLGPAPAPLLPHWDLLVAEHAFRQIGQTILPCNWLQCMEASVDPLDNPYLHGRNPRERGRRRARQPRLQSEFERYQYGIVQRCRLGDAAGDTQEWVEAHPLIFPVMVRTGAGFRQELQMRVPLDDTHTWNLRYQCFFPGEGVEVPQQEEIPLFDVPLKDESGEFIFDVPGVRDMVLWVSQGDIADRARETLGPADQGVEIYRRVLQQQVAIVEDGGDPMNVFRTPAEAPPSIDLRPRGDQAALPERTFDPRTLNDDIERYSPAAKEITRLYRAMRRAEREKTGAGAPRGRRMK
jgi:5,5'-dehydrodivanillate O-demethylase